MITENISRREFLKLGASGVGSLIIPKLGNPEVVEDDEACVSEWKEVSPLTKAGAELVGLIKDVIEENRLVNEIRAYRLPYNRDFPNATPIVICSRQYFKDLAEDDQAIILYGGMQMMFLPDSQSGVTLPVGNYDRVLKFGDLELGVVQKEKGDITRIWESDFYYKGKKLDRNENSWGRVHIEHLGDSEKYINKAVFFSDEKYYVLSSNGVEARIGKTLVFETDGGWSSVPVPDDTEQKKLEDIVVAKAGHLVAVSGLTDKPYSTICEPEIIDGQGWRWSSERRGKLSLLSVKYFMGCEFPQKMDVLIDPENQRLLNDVVDKVKKMWGWTIGVYVVTERKIPFYAPNTGELFMGERVKKPEYNFNLVMVDSSFEGRESSIAIYPTRIEVKPMQYGDRRLQT